MQRCHNLTDLLIPDTTNDLPKLSEQALAFFFKKKADDKQSKRLSISQPGAALKCVIHPAKTKSQSTLKVEDLITIKSNLNFGVNTTLHLAKEFGFKNRKIIESGQNSIFIFHNKIVDEMFSYNEFQFTYNQIG